ncbi:MAG: hypothetical protein KAI59_06660, partial [Planctomycetes bacterium]|nr:hypothetical protein [Planctomycetota bacterium]
KKSRLPVSFAASKQETETIATIEVPEPSLKHIEKLTDDTGMYQHAKFTIPDSFHGYCTDDNARAVIAMVKYYAQYPQPSVRKLFDTYLSFVLHSQNSDGTIRNFMNFDRTWQEPEPFNDALGRVLWAFGTVVAKPPSPSHLSIIKDCFDKSVIHVARQSPRGMAYSILGMSDYLRQFGGASEIKRQLALAADKLVALYEKNSHPDWQWFEDIMAYDNAVLPHALFAAYLTLKDERYLEVAEKTCEFLLETTFNSRHFSFIGCKGWYRRGKTKANFDQQPLEAASTVMMLSAAYQATQDKKFAALQRRAFDWFLGENDLQIPLYDFRSKGCNDGLSADGVNVNQGAESTLSFMLSLLTIVESYTIIDKVSENEAEQPDSGRANARPLQIKDIPSKDRYKKAEIEEFA